MHVCLVPDCLPARPRRQVGVCQNEDFGGDLAGVETEQIAGKIKKKFSDLKSLIYSALL